MNRSLFIPMRAVSQIEDFLIPIQRCQVSGLDVGYRHRSQLEGVAHLDKVF